MTPLKDPKDKMLKEFKKLDIDWRNAEMSKETEEVFKDISTAAMNLVALDMAQKMDTDLASLKEAAAQAGEVYSEGKKVNSLRIRFLTEVLNARGVEVPAMGDFLRAARDGQFDD